jgi:putative aminopeptidase FrvX
MNKESKEFLINLLNTCGPSGFEEVPHQVWCERTGKYADSIERDVMGNSVATLNKGTGLTVMLAGHCDEIGFIITHIDSKGFLYFEPIGGIDQVVIAGTHVTIQTDKGHVHGVIGKRATHLDTYAEESKSLKIKDAYIDVGYKNAKDAKKSVEVGDPVSFSVNYLELNNGIFSSKGCDDKTGAFVASEVIKILHAKKDKLKVTVCSAATVQEEVGLRGATTCAYNVNPDVAFAIDVTFASDTPEACSKKLGTVELGKGGVIHPGPCNNRILYSLLKEIGKKKKIPYQVQANGYPDGTDTSAIQLSRGGTATVLISVPNRYMHTQVETCSFKDLENCAKLIAETILSLKPTDTFIPKVK